MRDFIILLSCIVALGACTEKELTKEEVFTLLEADGGYPKVLSYEIYTKDSEDGKKLLAAGLEKAGLVTVERNRKTGVNHGAVIQFTEEANQYLLAPDKGQLSSVQRVKTAEEIIDDVSSLEMDDKTHAKITYTTKYSGVTPFARLDKKNFEEKKQYNATLTLTKDGWRLR